MIINIKDPIYKAPLVLYVGDAVKCEKYIAQKFHAQIAIEGHSYGMCTFKIVGDNGYYANYIWMPRWKNNVEYISMLAHEMIHVMCNTFDRVGINIDNNNDEPAAYYMELLFKTALNKLNK